MALEAMHDVLYARLSDEGARDSQKAVWQAAWNLAQEHPGKPLPCPVCFTHTSKLNRIEARNNEGDMATGRCQFCHTVYRWKDDD